MRRCPECRGFVPESQSQCPNCEFAPSAVSKAWWVAPLSLLGASAFAASACAIYGSPCASAALGDGGIDGCGRDLCNETLPDGGIKADDPAFKDRCPNPDGGN